MGHVQIKDNEFRCSLCGEVFEKADETEEQREIRLAQECRDNFNREHAEDDEIVCDDCYARIMQRFPKV